MRWWINLLITAFLIVFGGYIGALLGDPLLNSKMIYWCSVIIAFAVATQFFALKADEFEKEAKTYKDDMTAMMLKKKVDGDKSLDIALNPGSVFRSFTTNREYIFQVIVNSPIRLSNAPDLIISTTDQWNITASSIFISPIQHAGEYRYFIDNNKVKATIGQKYFIYEIKCTFQTNGEKKYKITAETPNLKSELANSLEVQ